MRLIRGSLILLLSGSIASAIAFFNCSDSQDATGTAADAADAQVDCSGPATKYAQVVCAADAFLATLTPAEQASVVYKSNPTEKTLWSNYPYNFPSCTRNGIKFGALSATSRAAALT